MNNAEWAAIVDRTWDTVQHISATKGREYTGDNEDRLANFYQIAELAGITPEAVWLAYFTKHVQAINTFVRDASSGKTRERSEPIEGRIDDAIVYLLLLKGLVLVEEDLLPADNELPKRVQEQFAATLSGPVRILNPIVPTAADDSEGGTP